MKKAVSKLLFGAAYYDEYMPYSRVEEDLRLMKNAGMNVIRIGESTWSTWEKTDGEFTFYRLLNVIRKAGEYGIAVIIGTPTYAIPSWLAVKHPEILARSKKGPAQYGMRQLIDLSDPDYRRYAERIIRKMMESVSGEQNVIGYQLDNETHHAYAYNDNAQQKFREYIRDKFPDIDEFNREFGLDYWSNRIDSFDAFPDMAGTINGSLDAEYQAFLRQCVTDFLAWQAGIVREYMKPGQFITHNFDYEWPGYSLGIQPQVDQQEAAASVDIAGCDIYHLSQDELDGATIAFCGAVARSLKKDNYLVLETQSAGNIEWLPYPGQLRLAAYSHIANGALSVMYWNWHSIHNSFESYWMGILGHDLVPGRIYRELKEWREEEMRIEDCIMPLKTEAEVCIMADNRSLTALEEFPASPDTSYNRILRSIADTLYKMNIQYDIVYKTDDISKYKAAFFPCLYSASEELITKIRKYVADGGHIFMTDRSCYADTYLKIYHAAHPYKLTDVIGATYESFTTPKNNTGVRPAPGFPGDKDITSASLFRLELLMPSTATVWAAYDHKVWGDYACCVHNCFGKGSATYLGTTVESAMLRELIKEFLKCAGIRIPGVQFPVVIRDGISPSRERIRFVMNFSDGDITYRHGNNPSEDLLTGRSINAGENMTIGPWGLLISRQKEN